MATIDLTRSSTYFTKHYQSVRAQQGRILSDDDHNDNERIHGEDMRRSRVDIIGPAGSPDDGFLVSAPTVTNGFIDFDILPGTFYLGGNRLELEVKETYQAQPDWLNMPVSAMIKPPAAGVRLDFVVLETYMQASTAIEDSEQFEKAFGGVDTAARMRTIQRVSVVPNVSSPDCSGNWATYLAGWAASGVTLSPENELLPDATLTVGFAPGSDPGDLCSPPIAGGYLGAYNQAIRAQLIDATHLTWGFDNASPLYRVKISTNGAGARTIVNMQSLPKDQPHWPLSGQTVEILPWSAVLVNEEKLSESSGFLTRIDASFDPDLNLFSMVDPLPAGFGEEWKTRPDAPQLAKDDFFYMRVWNRGSDKVSPPLIPFVSGTPVVLGQTGLSVTLNGTGFLPGDYWIIAARPDAPDRVVPWSLESGRGPHGIRRFVTALGVIEWNVTAGLIGTVIHDCRPTFPTLARMRTCCTNTVGDNVTSFGKYHSIQLAINALPAEGGEVCILPGIYKEHVVIKNRHDIIIHGCDSFTVLEDSGRPGNPIITIIDSQHISIHKLAMRATVNTAILMVSTPAAEKNNAGLSTIHIDHIHFAVRDRSAIEIDGGQFIRVRQNEFALQQLRRPLDNATSIGKEPAIFSRADYVLIEQNVIHCEVPRRLVAPLGGIQIGGGSRHVDIHRNKIVGGNGNGITLGSFHLLSPALIGKLSAGDYASAFAGAVPGLGGYIIFVDDNGCIHIVPDPPPPGGNNPPVPISDGDLEDIRIVDNDIFNMGANGIASVRLYSVYFGVVDILDCQIELNRIRSCVQLEPKPTKLSPWVPTAAFGGIVLAAVEYLTVRDNWIGDNGISFITPICGIFVQLGTGVVIEGNQIERNGPLVETSALPVAGPRGGIYFGLVLTPPGTRSLDVVSFRIETGFPAAQIANNVVIAPMGPAIYARALGAFLVEANNLASHAVDPNLNTRRIAFSGTTVWITNIGKAIEFTSAKVDYAGLGGSFSSSAPATILTTGVVACNDNQIVFEPLIRQPFPSFSSIFILAADDVALEDNQSHCVSRAVSVLTNAFVLSLTARIADNRFAEQPTAAFLSCYTLAAMNSTTDNQGTHCFLIVGNPLLTVRQPNRTYSDLTAPGLCDRFAKTLDKQFTAAGLSAI
jgi:hypothetical protein